MNISISHISLLVASFVCGIAMVVLLGWVLKIESFILVLPNTDPMNPTTALCFLFLGLAILFKNKIQGYLSATLGVLVIATGLFRIFEIFGLVDFSVDLLILREAVTSYFLEVRMSQYTAVSFILLAIVPIFNLFSFFKKARLAEICSSLTFIFALISLTAVFFEKKSSISIPLFFTDSVHTVFVFLIVSALMYMLFKEKDEKDLSFRSWVSILLLMLVFLSITALVAIFLGQSISDVSGERFEVLVIVLLGVVISLLVGVIFLMLFSSRDKAKAYAEKVTKDLRGAKARDEAMLSSIPDGMVATDKQGQIILINDNFSKLLGYSEQEVKGKKFASVVEVLDESGNKITESDCLIGRVLKEKTTIESSGVFLYRKKNGTTFPVASTASPILLEGKVVGVVEIFRDITRERAVDKAKTEFVSLASHQLRTPLSIMNWNLELLLDNHAGEISTEQRKYLREIYEGNKRMTALVNALLDVSKIEMGTMAIEPENVDVLDVINNVIEELKHEKEEKKLKLKLSLSKNIPIISADKKMLWMVFENLLTNAIKYTPLSGEIVLNLKLVKKGQKVGSVVLENDSLYFSISDTGLGIPKNQIENIFSKLFRADNAKEEDVVGSGLGLYIVKSIIERSGGRIWFETEQNKGTTFFFILPTKSKVLKIK